MKITSRAREDADPARVSDTNFRLHMSNSEENRNEAPEPYAGIGRMLVLVMKGALTGFPLGLILAVLAGSWVWLELRMNVGLLIPAAAFFSAVSSFWKRKAFPYALFLMGQVFLIVILLVRYGFNVDAFCAVPAYLFREGFHGAGLTATAAGWIVGGILVGGNLVWIAFPRERLSQRKDRQS